MFLFLILIFLPSDKILKTFEESVGVDDEEKLLLSVSSKLLCRSRMRTAKRELNSH